MHDDVRSPVPVRRACRPGASASATCIAAKERGERWADAHQLRLVHGRASSTRPASRCCSSATPPRTTSTATTPPCRSPSTNCCRWCGRSSARPSGRWSSPTCRSARTRRGRRRRCETAVRFMKEGGCHAVKLEGGRRVRRRSRRWSAPASRSWRTSASPRRASTRIGGYRVQGRGDAADDVLADAQAVAEAGAFAVVLEMVPGEVAKRDHRTSCTIPTIGIGAGPDCDAQVLVWQDMAGLRTGEHSPGSSSSTPTGRRARDARRARSRDEVRDRQLPRRRSTRSSDVGGVGCSRIRLRRR